MKTKHQSNDQTAHLTEKVEKLLEALADGRNVEKDSQQAKPPPAGAAANVERILSRTKHLMNLARNSQMSLEEAAEKLYEACKHDSAAAAAMKAAMPKESAAEWIHRLERMLVGLSQSVRQCLPEQTRRSGIARLKIMWEKGDSPSTLVGDVKIEDEPGTLCALRESAKDAARWQGEIDDEAAREAIAGLLLWSVREWEVPLPGFDLVGRNASRTRMLWHAPVAAGETSSAVNPGAIPEDARFVLFNQRPVIAAILDVILEDISVGLKEFPEVVRRICQHFGVSQQEVLSQFTMLGDSRVREHMSRGDQSRARVERVAVDDLIQEVLGQVNAVDGSTAPQKGVSTPKVLP
ncbi:MAG TPA: hypothetical protein VF669_18115 [Tepidisphaeraceae bacterium]|jgi:hypothetical protein